MNIKKILQTLNEATNKFDINDIIVFRVGPVFKIGKIVEVTKDNLGFDICKCKQIAEVSNSFNYFKTIQEDDEFFAPPETLQSIEELTNSIENSLKQIQNTLQNLNNFVKSV